MRAARQASGVNGCNTHAAPPEAVSDDFSEAATDHLISIVSRRPERSRTPVVSNVKIEIDIPDAIVEQLGFDAQVGREIIVLELYRREKISGGKAAELLGVPLYHFRGLLDRHGVELKYDMQELEEDIQSLKELGR
jgi:predicted HTH domain antitoxin